MNMVSSYTMFTKLLPGLNDRWAVIDDETVISWVQLGLEDDS